MSKITLLFLNIFFLTVFPVPPQEKDTIREEKLYKSILKGENLLTAMEYKECLELCQYNIKESLKLHNDYYTTISYNTIAGVYEVLKETDKALYYYNKALHHAQKSRNDKTMNWIYNNLGNIYLFDKKNADKGIELYLKSLQLSEKIKDTSEINYTRLNLGWAYFCKEEYEKGFSEIEFVKKHPKFSADADSQLILNTLYGIYYSHIKDIKKADYYFDKAIKIGEQNDKSLELAETYNQYSNHLFSIGNYKQAYLISEKEKILQKAIFTSTKLRNAQMACASFEIDEFKREIDKIESENKVHEQNLRMSRIIVVLAIVIMVFLLLLLFSLYRNIKFRKKINAYLTSENVELAEAKNRAEESSILKSQFISTISHELRTPLYGVIGMTNIIREEHPELEDNPHFKSLQFSSTHLLKLINEILLINKIEDKKATRKFTAFQLSDEINTIKDSLDYIAHRNKNEIRIEIDPDIPESLIGDKIMLSQVLVNLTSNALKFTTNGQVCLIVDLIGIDNGYCTMRFKVTDTGCGIDIQDQKKIFDKFVQINRKEEDYQGTGLGLSIVKALLDAQGSEITLESNKNVGSVFIFTLRFEIDNPKTYPTAHKQLNINVLYQYKVLIVEDNKINQMVTRKILEKKQCECVLAESGAEAVALLEKETFDVVLMDINMPVMNGFETTRLIRSKGITTPIIALTAFDKNQIIEEVYASGMDGIIIKPFEPEKLFSMIEELTHKKNAD